jgi:hypothetical protein
MVQESPKQIVFEKRYNNNKQLQQQDNIIYSKTVQQPYYTGLVEFTIGVTMVMIGFFVILPLMVTFLKAA